MNRKDRIAVVLSVVYLLLPITALTLGNSSDRFGGMLSFIPLVAYWGWRFIRNDISFLRIKE